MTDVIIVLTITCYHVCSLQGNDFFLEQQVTVHICCWKCKQGSYLCLGGDRGSGLVNKESSSFAFLLVWAVEFANLPLEKGGMLSFAPLLVWRSLMLNPLSSIKWSPFSRRSMIPLSCTIFRSLVLPDQSFEMKVKAPHGAIPTNNLSVLWCL